MKETIFLDIIEVSRAPAGNRRCCEVRMKIYQTKLETMDRENLKGLQLKKLQRMIDYCLSHSSFYRMKLRAAGIDSGRCIERLEEIRGIPYTTKDELREQYPTGMLAVPMNQVARIHASSGTTGKPTVGYYTQRDLDI